MNGVVAALIGVGGLILVNIIVAAVGYGRFTQKVSDLCRRVGNLEEIIYNHFSSDKEKHD